jgi:hypothetical protein
MGLLECKAMTGEAYGYIFSVVAKRQLRWAI